MGRKGRGGVIEAGRGGPGCPFHCCQIHSPVKRISSDDTDKNTSAHTCSENVVRNSERRYPYMAQIIYKHIDWRGLTAKVLKVKENKSMLKEKGLIRGLQQYFRCFYTTAVNCLNIQRQGVVLAICWNLCLFCSNTTSHHSRVQQKKMYSQATKELWQGGSQHVECKCGDGTDKAQDKTFSWPLWLGFWPWFLLSDDIGPGRSLPLMPSFLICQTPSSPLKRLFQAVGF